MLNRKVWLHPEKLLVMITTNEEDHQRFRCLNWQEVSHMQCHLLGTDHSVFDAEVTAAVSASQPRTLAPTTPTLGGSGTADERNCSPSIIEMKEFVYNKDSSEFIARFVEGTDMIQPVLKWTNSNSTYFNILRDFIHFSYGGSSSSSETPQSAVDRRAAVMGNTADVGTLQERASRAAALRAESLQEDLQEDLEF
jgi:hypothetical protein